MKRTNTVTYFMDYFLIMPVMLLIAAFTGMPAAPVSAESPSFVRIIHASPVVGTADVFLDGNKLLTSTQLSVPATLAANTVTSEFAVGIFNGTPKIQFVSSQVPGIPGLPKTGSDPNPAAVPGSTPASIPGLWEILALLMVGTVALFTWCFMHPFGRIQHPTISTRTPHEPQ